MKGMLGTHVALFVVVIAGGLAIAMVGPKRIWAAFGPADLGPVDFATLERRGTPNDALVCPPQVCVAEADFAPPVFATDAAALRKAMTKVIALERRTALVDSDKANATDRYVQRSAVLKFPDTIVVRTIGLPDGKSTVAMYSRSQLGYGDFGVNRARLKRWLDKLARDVGAPQRQDE